MASITKRQKGKYLKKESASALTQVYLETIDSQVGLEKNVTINGVTYHRVTETGTSTATDVYGATLADILAVINASGGKYRLAQGSTNAKVKLQISTDGGSTWSDVPDSEITVNNVASATSATNVGLSATVGSSAQTGATEVTATNNKLLIQAGTGTPAKITISSVPSATNATNATTATNVNLTAALDTKDSANVTLTNSDKKFEIHAGNGTAAVIEVASVEKAEKDLSGNVITTTYATKEELAGVEAGTTKAFVISDSGTSSEYDVTDEFIVAKGPSQDTVTISDLNTTENHKFITTTSSETIYIKDLKVGDVIYSTKANNDDWFFAGKVAGTTETTYTFYSIEADAPSLSGYVTGTSLSANEIILGNGNSAVKASGKTISTTAIAASGAGVDTHVLTEKAVITSIDNRIGALDVPATGTGAITGMGAGKTIATLTETDGKVAATFQDISITKSQVSDFPEIPTGFTISVTDGLLDGTGGTNSVQYAPYASKGAGHLYTGTTNPTSTNRLNYDGYFYATKLYSGGTEVLTAHQDISGKADAASMTAGTYSAVTVNTQGIVTAGAQMIAYVNSESADVSGVATGGTVIVMGAEVTNS